MKCRRRLAAAVLWSIAPEINLAGVFFFLNKKAPASFPMFGDKKLADSEKTVLLHRKDIDAVTLT